MALCPNISNIQTSTNVLWIRNWQTLLIIAGQTMHVHSLDGSTFLCEITLWLPSCICDVMSTFRLHQSMSIYLLNVPADFHLDPIWIDRALVFFEEVAPTRRRRRTTSCVAIGDQFLIQTSQNLEYMCISSWMKYAEVWFWRQEVSKGSEVDAMDVIGRLSSVGGVVTNSTQRHHPRQVCQWTGKSLASVSMLCN